MKGPRTRLAALAALAPATAAAQETSGFSHGWAYGLAALVLVLALFLVVFRRRPPPEGRDDRVAPPPR